MQFALNGLYWLRPTVGLPYCCYLYWADRSCLSNSKSVGFLYILKNLSSRSEHWCGIGYRVQYYLHNPSAEWTSILAAFNYRKSGVYLELGFRSAMPQLPPLSSNALSGWHVIPFPLITCHGPIPIKVSKRLRRQWIVGSWSVEVSF